MIRNFKTSYSLRVDIISIYSWPGRRQSNNMISIELLAYIVNCIFDQFFLLSVYQPSKPVKLNQIPSQVASTTSERNSKLMAQFFAPSRQVATATNICIKSSNYFQLILISEWLKANAVKSNILNCKNIATDTSPIYLISVIINNNSALKKLAPKRHVALTLIKSRPNHQNIFSNITQECQHLTSLTIEIR